MKRVDLENEIRDIILSSIDVESLSVVCPFTAFPTTMAL